MSKRLHAIKRQRYITFLMLSISLILVLILTMLYKHFFTSSLAEARRTDSEIFWVMAFVDEEDSHIYGAFIGVLSPKNSKIGIISIPSNMGLWRSSREQPIAISEMYSKYGINTLFTAIENVFQIRTDYKVVFNNNDIIKVVDLIGGIDMYVETPINFVDKQKGYNISFDTGAHLFTGEKILAYINHIQTGSYRERISLYKLEDVILNAMIGFIDSPILRSITTTKSFQSLAKSVVSSNLNSADYKELGKIIFNLNVSSFLMETLDGEINEHGVLVPINNAYNAVLQVRNIARIVASNGDDMKIENNHITMNVLNATEIVGLADRINIRMRYRGFLAVEYGNFITVTDDSVILIRNGEIEKAYIIARTSNVDKIYSVTDRSVLNNSTLVLGNDYYEIYE